ncbi:MAG: PxKF domain-containing protein [Gemmatimonadales bacterium]
MTGPCIPAVHPHRRRGRRLLPFLAILLAPLACTSDQPTEAPSPSVAPLAAATGSHPRARIQGSHIPSPSMRAAKSGASLSFSVVGTGSGPSVLILADADGASTVALADALTEAGFQVTVRPPPEYTWDGTNPALAGFDVVVHLNGSTYDGTLGLAAQQALNSFVENGGGYVGAQWNGVEWTPGMADLVLQSAGGSPDGPEKNCAACQVTYETIAGQESHPVLASLPSTFTFTADGHDAGPQVNTLSTVLMQVPSGGPAVLVRELGTGKVVNFSFAPNYPFDESGMPRDPLTLHDGNVQGLYVNAARWMAGSAVGEPEAQTITFDALADKTFGDPPFSISATASSDLPVSFTATGECTIVGSTVTLNAAGTCTITARQAGNTNYHPAEDVVRSFTIAQAMPLIHWAAPEPISEGTPLSGAQLNASATGVGGISLTGSWVYLPAEGTLLTTGDWPLSVEFIPSDGNYTGAIKTVMITVTARSLKFSGFFPPVYNMPFVNRATAGRAIPVKFSVEGNRRVGVLQPGSPTSTAVTCSENLTERPVEGSITRAASRLEVVGQNYTYVWKTSSEWAGTCRKLVVTLVDGSRHEALFRFVKPSTAGQANQNRWNTRPRGVGRG